MHYHGFLSGSFIYELLLQVNLTIYGTVVTYTKKTYNEIYISTMKICTEPFNHIVIDDFLPKDIVDYCLYNEDYDKHCEELYLAKMESNSPNQHNLRQDLQSRIDERDNLKRYGFDALYDIVLSLETNEVFKECIDALSYDTHTWDNLYHWWSFGQYAKGGCVSQMIHRDIATKPYASMIYLRKPEEPSIPLHLFNDKRECVKTVDNVNNRLIVWSNTESPPALHKPERVMGLEYPRRVFNWKCYNKTEPKGKQYSSMFEHYRN